MSRKLLCLIVAVVVVGTIFLSAYLCSAAPRGKGNERVLEKRIFIHFRKGYGKPPWAGGPKGEEKGPKCYDSFGKGIKWKALPVDYVIDPDNPNGLSQEFVVGAISAGAAEWNAYTSSTPFGAYSTGDGLSWDGDPGDQPDGRNELLFDDYPQDGVIAVTVVWGIFSGPPDLREISEFDILFDTDYTWGYAGPTSETELGNTDVMDLQNIATHELGHGLGLADVYNCPEVTMHGYSEQGETKKRTLADPDVTGIQELYGAP